MPGVEGRGTATDEPPFSHATGLGHITDTRGTAQYRDALRRGHPTTLYVVEPSGAMSPALVRDLRIEHARSRTPTAQDSTVYGTSRASPTTFYTHHVAAIGAAAATADARTLQSYRIAQSEMLSHPRA